MSRPRLHGWAPTSDDGDDVELPPAGEEHVFNVLPQGSAGPLSPPASAGPGSSQGVFNSNTTSNPIDNARVPRPRNAFIIFRTLYAKRFHSPETRKQRKGMSKGQNRTVSGRAADAWAKLNDTERAYYHHLSEREKEAHLLQHPGYQYRPRRRTDTTGGGTRSRRRRSRRDEPEGSSRPQKRARTARAAASRRSRAIVAESPPSTPRTADDDDASYRDSNSSASLEEPPSSPESEYRPLQRRPQQLQPTDAVDAATKADRRRSTSVPVTNGEHDYLVAMGWSASVAGPDTASTSAKTTATATATTTTTVPVSERQWDVRPTILQTRRRPASATQLDMAALGIPTSYDLHGNSQYSTPFRVQSPRPLTLDPASLFVAGPSSGLSLAHLSPLSASSSSSLANWNGELSSSSAMPSPAAMPVASLPRHQTWVPHSAAPAVPHWPLDPTGHYVANVHGHGMQPPVFGRSMSDPGLFNVGPELDEYAANTKEQDDTLFATYLSFGGLGLDSPSP
ncbi:HMG box domain-containing protein [Mycena chlorophos]|uniref:HMG box domain-containing protein n=1 Tax=Mycena chlorophos TaxID=658473 RepID=A0A8H6W885_MYCCL|nr:HMG box domain-containing protein [Mycena chlorophos]